MRGKTKVIIPAVLLIGLLGVSVFVAGNDTLQAKLQVVETYQATPVHFTLLADGPDGVPLTFSVVSQPTHGRLIGEPPELTYLPDPGFVGRDQITFLVESPSGEFDMGVVQINVHKANIVMRWIVPQKGVLAKADVDAQAGGWEKAIFTIAQTLVGQGVSTLLAAKDPLGTFSAGDRIPLHIVSGSAEPYAISLITLKGNALSIIPASCELHRQGKDCVVLLDTKGLAPNLYLILLKMGDVAYSLPVVIGNS